MTYEDYVLETRVIVIELILDLLGLLTPFRKKNLTPSEWTTLVGLIYEILPLTEVATVAREFYDSERQRQLETEELFPVWLANYEPATLYKSLEDARETFSQPDADESSLRHVIGTTVRQVENVGRRTILQAVGQDDRAQGWARVQGGLESCAFCLTLISRGPVYKSEETASFSAHDNCDCKATPVFHEDRWPGRSDYLEARKIWDKAQGKDSKAKIAWIRDYLKRRGYPEEEPLLDVA